MESGKSGLDYLMGKELFPFPGVRFNPTDVELVMFFLLRKVMGIKCPVEVIAEVDVYKVSPWDLPDKSIVKGDLKWYFLCPIEKKYSAGVRMNRATDVGHWKITGNERPVHYGNTLVGSIKTLIFHMGKAPGKRTDWVIHEYRLDNKYLAERGVAQNGHVLCMIFHKEGPGPKNNAQYGAPFKEEDWDNAAGTSQCDGTASESYLSETVLSEREVLPAVHSINVVSKEFNQDYDGDVTFSTLVVLNEDKKNKNPIHDGTDEALPVDESTINKDSGDLVNTAGLSEDGYDISIGSPDNCLYMGDLKKPLPPEAGESQHVSTNDQYPGYNANIHSEQSPLSSCDAAQQISVSEVCDPLPGFKVWEIWAIHMDDIWTILLA